jgi:hypothetical protein
MGSILLAAYIRHTVSSNSEIAHKCRAGLEEMLVRYVDTVVWCLYIGRLNHTRLLVMSTSDHSDACCKHTRTVQIHLKKGQGTSGRQKVKKGNLLNRPSSPGRRRPGEGARGPRIEISAAPAVRSGFNSGVYFGEALG